MGGKYNYEGYIINIRP